MRVSNFINNFIFLFALVVSQMAFSASLSIVTTVKPLGFILKEIVSKDDKITILLPSSASPHVYALKPSDLQKINQADVIFWIGPELELFLEKMLNNKPNAFALIQSPSLTLFETKHDAHEHHRHSNVDPHIWLGVDQVKKMAQAMASELSKVSPEKKMTYETNLHHFIANLDTRVAELKKTFSTLTKQGYYMFHDAYGYFEASFDLKSLGHLTVNPERKPGAKTLIEIRKQLLDNKAACVFSEPQFNPSTVLSLTRGTGAKIELIDPLGKDLDIDKNTYLDFLSSLAASYFSCFDK